MVILFIIVVKFENLWVICIYKFIEEYWGILFKVYDIEYIWNLRVII